MDDTYTPLEPEKEFYLTNIELPSCHGLLERLRPEVPDQILDAVPDLVPSAVLDSESTAAPDLVPDVVFDPILNQHSLTLRTKLVMMTVFKES